MLARLRCSRRRAPAGELASASTAASARSVYALEATDVMRTVRALASERGMELGTRVAAMMPMLGQGGYSER